MLRFIRHIPPRLRTGILWYWAAFTAFGLWLSNRPPFTRFLDFWETLPWLAFLFLLAAQPKLRELLGALGRGHRVLALVFFALIFAGQIASDSKRTWPFVQWKMYTSFRPGTTYLEYEARFASGERDHYPFNAVGPKSSPRAFMGHFHRGLDRVATPDPATLETSVAELVSEMRHLMRIYNARHPDDPIVAMAVYHRSVPVRDYAGPESMERRLLAVLEE